MFTKQELIEFCETARTSYLDHISIDCVVFGFHEGQLKVLSLKVKNEESWYLPGGFVQIDEPIEMAANRILKDRTGLDEIFLQQFHVFGDPERSRPHNDMYKDMLPAEEHWFAGRFLTIGYYALVDFINVNPTPDINSEKCTWVDLSDMPALELDHDIILKT